MDQVLEQLKEKTAILDQFGNKIPPLKDFCDKQKINTGLPLGAVLFVVFLITMLIEGWYILTMALTVIYPGLHSIRAIESKEKDDDKVWLTYWMVFGTFNVLETFFGFILYFIPYFAWIRLGFFIWLLVPQFKGSETLYNTVLKPLLDNNKDLIRDLIAKTRALGSSAVSEAASAASDPTLIMKGVSAASAAQAKIAEAVNADEDEVVGEVVSSK